MVVKVVGGGLAGCEASYQLLKRGATVCLYEMRPHKTTGAHETSNLAELVCSNSLKSLDVHTAQGLLKKEIEALDSLIIKTAKKVAVPSGSALSVDRLQFSRLIEKELKSFSNFKLVRREIKEIDDYSIIATGPLTSESMCKTIEDLTSSTSLNFYDAVSPIIEANSINMDKAFFASRYNKGTPDYLNLGLSKEEYYVFQDALEKAERVILKPFEKKDIFEGCIPIEEIARRGKDAMRFGPLRPVGMYDNDGNNYYAVVQLRKENLLSNMYNMVGFQTNLKFKEQDRVFRLIPALKEASFVRYGVMHKNTYIESPKILTEFLNLKNNDKIFFAGQIIGVEGYVESTAMGLIAGINMSRLLKGRQPISFNNKTIIGGLINYVANEPSQFRPMNANYGLLNAIEVYNKKERKEKALLNSMQEIEKIKLTLEV